MKKKIIFTVLAMYLLCTLASPIVFAEEKSEQKEVLGIFTPEISFEFTKNLTDEPINPLQTQEIDIKVKFRLNMGSLAKLFFFNRRIGRLILFGPGNVLRIRGTPKSNLTLSISECPTWCSAKIDTETFEFNLGDSPIEKTIKLEFTVNENATALDKGDIKIQADFMGRWTIKAVTNSTTIPVTVAYIPELFIEVESEFIIPPLQNTTVPINITNNGNGDSIIFISYNTPENWTATFDQENFTLKINETKQITLTVNPPKGFTNQTIDFSFISILTGGLYPGTPFVFSMIFINDGSLKEEGGQEVLVVGIIILVIIIILLVTFLLLRKKKQ